MRRHLLWRQLLNSSLGYTRKPVEAVSFVHEAMVLESESAYMRRGDSWGYRSRYRYRQGGRRRGAVFPCVSAFLTLLYSESYSRSNSGIHTCLGVPSLQNETRPATSSSSPSSSSLCSVFSWEPGSRERWRRRGWTSTSLCQIAEDGGRWVLSLECA